MIDLAEASTPEATTINDGESAEQPEPEGQKSIGELTCRLCLKTFSCRSKLADHQLSHEHVVRYACDEPGCNSTFIHHRSLRRHWKEVHLRGDFRCPYCRKSFPSKSYLKIHMKKEQEHLNCLQCRHCRLFMNTYAEAAEHTSQKHPQFYTTNQHHIFEKIRLGVIVGTEANFPRPGDSEEVSRGLIGDGLEACDYDREMIQGEKVAPRIVRAPKKSRGIKGVGYINIEEVEITTIVRETPGRKKRTREVKNSVPLALSLFPSRPHRALPGQ